MILGISKVALAETETVFLYLVTLVMCLVWLYFVGLVNREYKARLSAEESEQ